MSRWKAVIAVEGRVTADGRLIEPTAIEWADEPQRRVPLVRSPQAGEGDHAVIGWLDRLWREEGPSGEALVWGEGDLIAEPPAKRDLSVIVISGEYDIAGEGVDYPLALVHCRLQQIAVGADRVWDECLLEVVPD
ncbi:hypothetical protein QDA04_gp76 [Microbacterium phage Megan]|uniref:Uncharacterized protein n=1 Tax=Microbacterium phage Megan TaxID=2656551 RepID=A0A649VK44_9CAUD|nr:hypothetical protein QDA04_gp76 [Microbacterium phage Megan]QGJ92746.1 hypothetical protein PBI_MEGAN_76 [Microbacterium phage Megan]